MISKAHFIMLSLYMHHKETVEVVLQKQKERRLNNTNRARLRYNAHCLNRLNTDCPVLETIF